MACENRRIRTVDGLRLASAFTVIDSSFSFFRADSSHLNLILTQIIIIVARTPALETKSFNDGFGLMFLHFPLKLF